MCPNNGIAACCLGFVRVAHFNTRRQANIEKDTYCGIQKSLSPQDNKKLVRQTGKQAGQQEAGQTDWGGRGGGFRYLAHGL